jgi:hypothetical protein
MKRLGITAALLVLVASVAAGALASRKPDHDEAVAITKAFKTTPMAGLKKIAYQFNVRGIRVSTVNPRYAKANLVAKPKYRDTLQGGYGVAKLDKSDRWKAYNVGSSGVGCPGGKKGVVPKPVRKDLKLHCP